MSDRPDYYAVLNLSPNASLTEIKKAFRRLARQYHPDVNPNNLLAKIKFQEVSAAYEILGDPEKRYQYDQQLNSPQSSSPVPSLTPQDYYVKGAQKYLVRHYQEAIDCFSQAISLKPDFLEAYLQRCEVYFHLGSDPEVLEDCYQILQLDSRIWQAHYYQGRIRQKLGYLEAALQAYTQGISVNSQEPRIYYDRGLAYQELGEKKRAIKDFNTASALYHQQGRTKGYRSAQHQLKKLRSLGQFFPVFSSSFLGKWLEVILLTFFQVLFNPSGEILPQFSRLSRFQRFFIGVFYALIAQIITMLMMPQFKILGLLILGSLTLWILLINFQQHRQFKELETIFIVGNLALSLSLLLVTWTLLSNIPQWLGVSLLISLGASSFLILYCSFTQILNISEQNSTYLMTLTLMLILGLFTLVTL